MLAIRSGEDEKMAIKDDVWKYLKEKDKALYTKMRTGLFGTAIHLPGKGGQAIVKAAYAVARGIFGFN